MTLVIITGTLPCQSHIYMYTSYPDTKVINLSHLADDKVRSFQPTQFCNYPTITSYIHVTTESWSTAIGFISYLENHVKEVPLACCFYLNCPVALTIIN